MWTSFGGPQFVPGSIESAVDRVEGAGSNLRKDMRDNRKKAKNASKRKKRLVQALLAPPHTVMF